MSAIGPIFYSIPVFQKDSFSLDTTGNDIVVSETITFPTLEHVLWYLLGLDVKPTGTPSYLRNKVRSTKGFLEKAIQTWDNDLGIQAKFGSLWMKQIMTSQENKDTLLGHASDGIPDYYTIIPKNKGHLYAPWTWSPDIADRCGNRLGILLRSMVASMNLQKSSITPV